MPQLVAFNRRWTIGGDDFVYPGLIEICLRIVWVIGVSIVFHLHKDTFNCDGGELLKIYYIGLLSLLVISTLMTIAVVYISSKGTITNTSPRRKVAKLIYVKCAISFPELAWNIMGSYWAFGKSSGCEIHVVTTVKAVVLSGWVIGLIVIAGIAIVFDPLGKLHNNAENLDLHAEEAKRVWETRCKILCCCVGRDEKTSNAFSGIADLLSNFFKGIDLVPTDIACGLILIHREQQRIRYQLSTISVHPQRGANEHRSSNQIYVERQLSASSSSVPDGSVLPTPKSWMTVDMMWHYMKFAMGSYGWPLYIFTHLVTGACQLWSQCHNACLPGCLGVGRQYDTRSCLETCLDCVSVCRSQSVTLLETEKEFNELCLSLECCSCMMKQSGIRDDNCCRCNMAAIKKTTGAHPDDIVYASFHDKIYEIPFYVCIDRDYQAVVVSVRGTLSLRDVITDLTADCETLDIDGVHSFQAHKGMVQAAKYVKSTLENQHILEQAFDRAQGAKLVITGHSLGAGTAALLAIMLKPKYPDLMCFSYSPPGGLMSLEASQFSQDFTCSVVLGNDMIPRLGIHTMEDLRTSLLKEIHDCDLPKFQLLASGVWQMCCGLKAPSEEDMNKFKQRRPLLDSRQNGSAPQGEQSGLENALHEAVQHSEQCRITHTRMYPPGQIVHILDASVKKSCCGIPDYHAVWARAEDFQEVLVGPSMVADHLPDAVMRALDQLKERDIRPTLRHPGSIITL